MEVTRHLLQTRISRRRYINKPEDTVLTDLLRLLFDQFETTIRAVYRFLTRYMFATNIFRRNIPEGNRCKFLCVVSSLYRLVKRIAINGTI